MGCNQSNTVAVAAPGGDDTSIKQKSNNNRVIEVSRLDKVLSDSSMEGRTMQFAVYCMDIFVSKYSGDSMHKWRAATIIDKMVSPDDKIKVHFDGWTSKSDCWIDLHSELHRLCPVDTLSLEELNQNHNVSLSPNYLKHTEEFLVKMELYYGSSKHHKDANANLLTEKSEVDLLTKEFSVKEMVDVQDVFKSNLPQNGRVASKWRRAEIKEISGNTIRVHYVGLDDKWDEVINILKEKDRVRKDSVSSNLAKDGRGKLRRRRRSSANEDYNLANSLTNSQSGSNRNISLDSGTDQKKDESSGNEMQTDELNFMQSFHDPPKRKDSWKRSKIRASPNRNQRQSFPGPDKLQSAERVFEESLEKEGLYIVEIEGDGNCLFRAIAHQLYLDQERHVELRKLCADHMVEHQERFEKFCSIPFKDYIRCLRKLGTWGDHLEIKAMEEILDRLIIVHSSDTRGIVEASNKRESKALKKLSLYPITLSYHQGCHYNSVFNEKFPLPLGHEPLKCKHVILRVRLKEKVF